jgi:hypothetical protein
MVILALGACSSGHLNLESPPANLTKEQRLKRFASLAPVGYRLELVDQCNASGGWKVCKPRVDSRSVLLADGREMRHAEDLLPVVAPSSKAAQHARAVKRAVRNQTYSGVGGIAVSLTGGFIWYESRTDDAYNIKGNDTGKTIGMTMLAVGVITAVVGSWIYHSRAERNELEAFELYQDGLAEGLRICFADLKPFPCEEPPTPPATSEPPRLPTIDEAPHVESDTK